MGLSLVATPFLCTGYINKQIIVYEVIQMGRLQRDVNDLYTWCLNNGEFGQQLIKDWAGLNGNNIPISMNSISRASHTKGLTVQY